MWTAVVSIFPEMFHALTGDGVVARAIAGGNMSLRVINPRDFAADRRRSVDDHSYGGGPGVSHQASLKQCEVVDSLMKLVHERDRESL